MLDVFSFRRGLDLPDLEFNSDNLPDWLISAPTPRISADAEMSWECELGPSAAKIFGLDRSNGPDITAASMIVNSPYQVPIRRHKKKRINKKWNKKYGPRYIIKFRSYQLGDVRFEPRGRELEIIGERVNLLVP